MDKGVDITRLMRESIKAIPELIFFDLISKMQLAPIQIANFESGTLTISWQIRGGKKINSTKGHSASIPRMVEHIDKFSSSMKRHKFTNHIMSDTGTTGLFA